MVTPKKIKNIGILPWRDNEDQDPHQKLFAESLMAQGINVVKCKYKFGTPISHTIYNANIDCLIIDWAHSFFTSKPLSITILKTLLGSYDRLLIRKRKIPIIWNLHNLHRHDKLHKNIEKWSFTKLAHTVDGIRVFNENAIREAKDYFKLSIDQPIINLPQGVYKYPVNSQSSDTFKKQLKINDGEFTLLFFGTLRAGKGLLKFTKSFLELEKSKVKLIIAGEPIDHQLTNELKEMIKTNSSVILHDKFIADADINNYFSVSDAVVMPYEHILNSGVQLLANSYGKPILASDIPLFRSSLSDTYAVLGNLYEKKSLESALVNLMNRDLISMSNNSKSAAAELNWENITPKFIDFAEQLAKKYK